ncbi:MAG: P22 coat protein - protein 5 domain protein [Clostridia bacterium]|nr:P22 coat protein - protein 5 domain protein [Clostridia bacterium]
MAIMNFISTVWSETLASALNKQYVAVANCNRDFEGEIKEKGSRVKICSVGDVTVGDYTKNTDMSDPQTLSDSAKELIINRAKYFNFQLDDIDRAQALPGLMSEAMRKAAAGLAEEADKYVFSLYENAGTTITNEATTAENILDNIIYARTALYANGVGNTNDIVMEVSPAVAALILKAKITLSTDNGEMMESGCLGSFGGCKIYVSPNISVVEGSGVNYHKCLVRTKRAIAFAEQLSEIDAYRPEKRFADALKGLHLYGAKTVFPNEMVLLDLGIAA